MTKNKLFMSAAAIIAGLVVAGGASATSWTALVIENYTGNVASASAFKTLLASAVHIGDVSQIDFNSHGGADYTIGSWLATGGFTYAGPIAGDTLNNTLWLFYTDQSFASAPKLTITHDDGVEVPYKNINGTLYSGFTAALTSPTTETGSCPSCSGPGQVGIVYNEASGAPGVLQAGIVPEPSTWAMMLIGLGGLGMAMRRSRKTASVIA